MVAYPVFVFALIAFSAAQYQKSSKEAAILSEARYLTRDGQFGSAYKQEDGVEFKEESDVQGNRRGQYSYVDPSGVRRTVHYTAGKDGFKATGDHLPVAPPAPSAPAVVPVQAAAADPYHQSDDDYDDSKNYQYNDYQYVSPNVRPQPAPQPPYNPVASQLPYNAIPQPSPFNVPAPQFNLAPQHQQQQQQPPLPPSFNPLQFQYQAPQPSSTPFGSFFSSFTTEQPQHRFQSPGKLNVNRSPDGFSYTFNKI